ncbi:hypothetical protein BH10ACT9_BH10ACT9_58220 [soil metagenome]
MQTMTEYNGTVADLAKDVGEALEALHKVIWSMRYIDILVRPIERVQPELQLIENVAHRLRGQVQE